jgi:hypothetical protein
VRRLFLSVIFRRSKKRHSVPMPTATPCSARPVRSSARVMSRCRSRRQRIRSACPSIRPDLRSPPSGPDLTSPCLRTSARQRIALDALTPNRNAAWRHDIPPSIAATTRSRKSTDSALLMHAGLLTSMQFESEPS